MKKIDAGLEIDEVKPPEGGKMGIYRCAKCGKEFKVPKAAEKRYCKKCWFEIMLPIIERADREIESGGLD